MSDKINLIIGLYDEYPKSGKRLLKLVGNDIGSHMKGVESPATFSVGDLAKLDPEYSMRLSQAISCLPPGAVSEILGNDALIWATITLGGIRPVLREQQKIKDITGIDFDELFNLDDCLTRITGRKDLKTSLFYYRITNDMRRPLDAGLRDILLGCANEGVRISGERMDDYSLEPGFTEYREIHGLEKRWGMKMAKNRVFELYMDVPTGLILMYKGLPNAVVGFIPTDTETVMIYQIQGVMAYLTDDRGKKLVVNRKYVVRGSRGLAPIDWEKAMVEVAEGFASNVGAKRIGIMEGRKNRWLNNYLGPKEYKLESAMQRYDKTAMRLGYKMGDDRNWYKNLPL